MMVKWCLRVLIVIFASIIVESSGLTFSAAYFSTIFNLIGIMFSVAFSQLLSFSFSEVTNDDFVIRHRGQLHKIQNIFIVLFILSTLCFYFSDKCHIQLAFKVIKFTVRSFLGCFECYVIIYYIVNFVSLVKLKNEIDDRIRKAKKQ